MSMDADDIMCALEALLDDGESLDALAGEYGVSPVKMMRFFDRVRKEGLAERWRAVRSEYTPDQKEVKAQGQTSQPSRLLRGNMAQAIKLIVLDGWSEAAVLAKFKIDRATLLVWGESAPAHLRDGWGKHLAMTASPDPVFEEGHSAHRESRMEVNEEPKKERKKRATGKDQALIKAKAIAMVASGKSICETARTLGVHRANVERWCKRAGVTTSFSRGRPRSEGHDRSVELVGKEGMTYSEAARAQGVSDEAVRERCMKVGILSRLSHKKNRPVS